MSIKDIFTQIDIKNDINTTVCCYGWVRTVRSSSSSLGFCTLNDGSNVSGLQIVISVDYIKLQMPALSPTMSEGTIA